VVVCRAGLRVSGVALPYIGARGVSAQEVGSGLSRWLIQKRASTGVAGDRDCQLRGIFPYTAMLVIAEVGEIERFRSARHLWAWAGLTPTVRSPMARRGSATSPGKAPPTSAGRWSRLRTRRPRVEVRCAPPSSGSPNAAAATSPRSHSPGACSPSATTVCATARSAACKLRGRRARVLSRRRHERPSTT
jgi:hypothetical protein